jgi:predicted MPP superfamily phosphohydrolase
MKQSKAAALDRLASFRVVLLPLIWVALHLYAGRPLLVAAHARGIAPELAWGGLVGLSALTILPLFARSTKDIGVRSVLHWTGYALMSIFSLLLVLVMAGDALRALYWLVRIVALITPAASTNWPPINIRTLDFSILGGTALLFVIGLIQARRPKVVRVQLPIAGLAPELDRYRIVQLSDVHVGPTIQQHFVTSLVARVNRLQPDAIAITGDLVDAYVDDIREQVQPLRELAARDGVFYVTGNHEYYWRAAEWLPELQSLGLTFLRNEHRVIARGDARLVIAGVTDPVGRGAHASDPDAALAGVPRDAATILLAHRPQAIDAATRLGVDLQLSGHTHGGQFFPFNLVIRWFQPIVAGLSRSGATWLYVSRGTGYWGPPSRLGVGGEITLIELVAA